MEEDLKKQENRGVNLGDLLKKFGGGEKIVKILEEKDHIRMSIEGEKGPKIIECPLYLDKLSGMKTFFTMLPLKYLHHDDRINPRSIGSNVRGLIEEFQDGKPQLQVSLAWWGPDEGKDEAPIKVFDGQHKAAAQILLNVRELPLRVFFKPDINVLLEANTNAGDKLKQVAFDSAVKRHLGNALYNERIQEYQKHKNLPSDNYTFSEDDLVKHFLGESRQIIRYILDAVRDNVTRDPNNKLFDYVEYAGKETKRPLSYSAIEKTFHPLFLYPKALTTPIGQGVDEGKNPRILEKSQMIQLMSLFAEVFFIGQWDSEITGSKLENKIIQGEKIPLGHLRAWRVSREEVLYNILIYVRQAIQFHFVNRLKMIDLNQLMQEPFSDELWTIIKNVMQNIADLPCWVDYKLAHTIFGGKPNRDFWTKIFKDGVSPTGIPVLAKGLEIGELMTPKR